MTLQRPPGLPACLRDLCFLSLHLLTEDTWAWGGRLSHMQISVLFTVRKHRWEHIKDKILKALNPSSDCLEKKPFLSKKKIHCKRKQVTQIFSCSLLAPGISRVLQHSPHLSTPQPSTRPQQHMCTYAETGWRYGAKAKKSYWTASERDLEVPAV